jgi:hypothetical protein
VVMRASARQAFAEAGAQIQVAIVRNR